MEWMFVPLKRYAEFSGRSRRMEFWMWFLFQFLLGLAFVILLVASVGMGALSGDPRQMMAGVGGAVILYLLWGLISLAFFIPNLAVTIRRLHDSGRSGFWVWLLWGPYLLTLVISFMGVATMAGGSDDAGVGVFSGILGLAWLAGCIVLLVFMFLPGQRGQNQYGPDPKGGVSAQVFA
jgi:uncharacterized membrane protein YhaH (DUF805 family)